MKATVTEYMRYEKVLPSAQGMAVWENRAFILYDGGMCGVYDLKRRQAAPQALFPLGSYNEGIPTRDYRNHANSCMFSRTFWMGNTIPLLYVTVGSGTGCDVDGYFYRCAVENITCCADAWGVPHYEARTVQVITYRPETMERSAFVQPCWGCPSFLVDDALYIFSAKYRTKRGYVPEGEKNEYIITRFELPNPFDCGLVRLGPRDILEQFSVKSDIEFTQGGQLTNGRIYYTFGLPKKNYPNHVAVFDLALHTMTEDYTQLDEAMHEEELECCDFYNGKLLCNTNGGGLYELGQIYAN